MLRQLIAGAALMIAGVADAKTPKVGDVAPDFRLKLIDGSTVSIAELRGQVVVLNFWATWCVPCRKELPLLDTYYRLQQPYGLRVFAVTTEDSLQTYQLKPLFHAMAIPAVRSIKGPYGVMTGVPTNYIIDRSGHIRYAKAGAFDLATLNEVLVPLLREAAPPPS